MWGNAYLKTLHWFPNANVTNYHKFSILEEHKFFLRFQSSEVQEFSPSLFWLIKGVHILWLLDALHNLYNPGLSPYLTMLNYIYNVSFAMCGIVYSQVLWNRAWVSMRVLYSVYQRHNFELKKIEGNIEKILTVLSLDG